MAYIVLALGVLMALVGLGAMATGYPVIEIERGWATVIAGAVLLSGGIVTAALGVVVRLLVGLRGMTGAQAVAGHPLEAPGLAPEMLDAPIAPVQAATMPKPAPVHYPFEAAPALAVAAPAAAMTAAAFAADTSSERGAAPVAASPMPAAQPEPEPAYPEPEPVYEEPEPEPAYEEPEPTEHHSFDDASPLMEEPEHADHPHEQEPLAHEAAPESPMPRHETHPLSGEAWLDQAFQAFDYEMTGGHPPAAEEAAASDAEPETPPAPQATHPVEAAHEEPLAEEVEEPAILAAPHEHSPHDEPARVALTAATEPTAEAPSTAPDAARSNLTVIGRYDSDGTSYVMYSDGSIEAQSEAGVYRFGSMAELKAFIEG